MATWSYVYSQQDRGVIANNPEPKITSQIEIEKPPESIKDIVSSYTSKSTIGETLYKLAHCESGLKNICIIDTNGKSSCGIFMYQKSTFDHYCTGNIMNPLDQLKCAEQMIRNGRLHQDWVNCGKKIDENKLF